MFELPRDQDKLFAKAKKDGKLIREYYEPYYIYSCRTPGCRHNPCLNMEPPQEYLAGAEIGREYELVIVGGILKFTSRFKRYYKKLDDTSEYSDSPELVGSCEYESRLD